MILFLNAPGVEFHQRSSRWGGKVNRSGYLVPPIFLSIASAWLDSNGLDAHILDAAALGLSSDELDNQIRAMDPDLVIIEASTISINHDVATALHIRELHKAKVALVGLHVSALPEQSLREYQVDYICVGEYEDTILDLSRALRDQTDLSLIPGLGWRNATGDVVINSSRPLADINRYPPPAYRELPLKNYWDPIARNHPCISIRTMRGCPFHCVYCVAPQLIYHGQLRFREPSLVVEEIRMLRDQGVKEVFIDDETFTVKRDHVLSICREIRKAGIRIDWSCFGRVDCIDRELLQEMKRAGCYMVRYGVESSDNQILRNIRKGFTTDQVREAFKLTHSLSMKTHATVMYGSPGETPESMRRTLDFTLALDPDYTQFTITTPYPGTDYYNRMKREGRIIARNWDEYDGSCRMIVRLDSVKPEEVEKFVEESYRRFYFRPHYIFKRLSGLRRSDEFYYLLRSGFNLLRQRFGGHT